MIFFAFSFDTHPPCNFKLLSAIAQSKSPIRVRVCLFVDFLLPLFSGLLTSPHPPAHPLTLSCVVPPPPSPRLKVCTCSILVEIDYVLASNSFLPVLVTRLQTKPKHHSLTRSSYRSNSFASCSLSRSMSVRVLGYVVRLATRSIGYTRDAINLLCVGRKMSMGRKCRVCTRTTRGPRWVKSR